MVFRCPSFSSLSLSIGSASRSGSLGGEDCFCLGKGVMWSCVAQWVCLATTVLEVRTALGQLETNVHEEYISPQFKRKPTPVKGAWLTTGAQQLHVLRPEVQTLG